MHASCSYVHHLVHCGNRCIQDPLPDLELQAKAVHKAAQGTAQGLH